MYMKSDIRPRRTVEVVISFLLENLENREESYKEGQSVNVLDEWIQYWTFM